MDIELVGIISNDTDHPEYQGLPVLAGPRERPNYDAILVVDTVAPQDVSDQLRKHFPPERILAPKLLRLSQHTTGAVR